MQIMKISIITVVYNAAISIERTIKSVLSQSYRNVEYIIIDGGSTDGTLDIIAKYRNRLAFFISEPDHGIYDAMNKGIKKATGDIIGLLNADDWYEPEALQNIADGFKNSDADIVMGGAWCIDKDGNKHLRSAVPFSEMGMGMPAIHQAIFISRNAYDSYGLHDLNFQIVADYELLLRMYHGGAKASILDAVLVNYSTTGFSSMQPLKWIEEMKVALQKHIDFYKGHEAEMLAMCNDKIKKMRISYCLENFHESVPVALSKIGITRKSKNVIWGAGARGKRIADIFHQFTIPIDFFVDSDEKKLGQKFCGVDIKTPSALNSYDGTVFIAVKDHDSEIVNAIATMGNQKVKCACWNDFLDAIAECYEEFEGKAAV